MLVSKHMQMSLKRQLRNSIGGIPLHSIGGLYSALEKYPSSSVYALHCLLLCFLASQVETLAQAKSFHL